MDADLPMPSALPIPLGEEAVPSSRAAILARLRERIVAFAASRYAGAHAEDLAQEVLMLLHEKYGHLDRIEDLLPLAFQILRFKLAAHRRKAARRGEYDAVDVDVFPPISDAPDPATVLERKELLAKLMGGIARMGERCRELFRLKLQGRWWRINADDEFDQLLAGLQRGALGGSWQAATGGAP